MPVHPRQSTRPIARDEIDAHVRQLVADRLGVELDELGDEVSLVDDLATDSLELLEIAVAIEEELGVVIPRRLLDGVRSCCDLVDAALVAPAATLPPAHEILPLVVRARIASPGASLERVLALTPYGVETILEDAVRAGHGAQLELTVAAGTSRQHVAWLTRRFATLGDRGIAVHVRRDGGARAA
jgi:acyl carrier protein